MADVARYFVVVEKDMQLVGRTLPGIHLGAFNTGSTAQSHMRIMGQFFGHLVVWDSHTAAYVAELRQTMPINVGIMAPAISVFTWDLVTCGYVLWDMAPLDYHGRAHAYLTSTDFVRQNRPNKPVVRLRG